MLATRQPQRTYEGLRQAGVQYHSLREGGRLGQREDSLGTQHVPSEEAGFERAAELRLDFEAALRCPGIAITGRRKEGGHSHPLVSTFEAQQITFDYLANHGGNWPARHRMAKRWGLSPGAIHRIADDTLLAMVRHCGGRCGC